MLRYSVSYGIFKILQLNAALRQFTYNNSSEWRSNPLPSNLQSEMSVSGPTAPRWRQSMYLVRTYNMHK